MASLQKDILIDDLPERVWDAVRDVGAVHHRLVPGLVSTVSVEEDLRILTFPDGRIVQERIVAIDDEKRRLAYAVIEARMPLIHHHASFQVFADGPHRTRLVWITDFLPHSLANEIHLYVERGAIVMKEALENQSHHHSSQG